MVSGTRPVDASRPVCHVSHYKAGAYATWAGNGKFMSSRMVLRGGCALTPPGHTRASHR